MGDVQAVALIRAARSRRAHLGVQPFEAAAFVVALRKISDPYLDLGV